MATKKKAASKPAKGPKKTDAAPVTESSASDVSATLATTVCDSEQRKLDRIAQDPFLKHY
jgi:hypothetical protein